MSVRGPQRSKLAPLVATPIALFAALVVVGCGKTETVTTTVTVEKTAAPAAAVTPASTVSRRALPKLDAMPDGWKQTSADAKIEDDGACPAIEALNDAASSRAVRFTGDFEQAELAVYVFETGDEARDHVAAIARAGECRRKSIKAFYEEQTPKVAVTFPTARMQPYGERQVLITIAGGDVGESKLVHIQSGRIIGSAALDGTSDVNTEAVLAELARSMQAGQ